MGPENGARIQTHESADRPAIWAECPARRAAPQVLGARTLGTELWRQFLPFRQTPGLVLWILDPRPRARLPRLTPQGLLVPDGDPGPAELRHHQPFPREPHLLAREDSSAVTRLPDAGSPWGTPPGRAWCPGPLRAAATRDLLGHFNSCDHMTEVKGFPQEGSSRVETQ